MIAAELGQEDFCKVGDLALRHGVSERTIARDLALMRECGMQIDADIGRGGGVRLKRNWGAGRVNLNHGEAVDLLISIAVAEKMNSPMFLASLASVRRQLVASFSPEKRDRVNRLKSRILIGVTASTYVQADFAALPRRIVQSLHTAFINHEALQIVYQREDGATSRRLIEPHYLLLKYPVWYVIAIDHLRSAPRVFRCDRIQSATIEGSRFRLLPKKAFQTPLEKDDLSIGKRRLAQPQPARTLSCGPDGQAI